MILKKDRITLGIQAPEGKIMMKDHSKLSICEIHPGNLRSVSLEKS